MYLSDLILLIVFVCWLAWTFYKKKVRKPKEDSVSGLTVPYAGSLTSSASSPGSRICKVEAFPADIDPGLSGQAFAKELNNTLNSIMADYAARDCGLPCGIEFVALETGIILVFKWRK